MSSLHDVHSYIDFHLLVSRRSALHRRQHRGDDHGLRVLLVRWHRLLVLLLLLLRRPQHQAMHQ